MDQRINERTGSPFGGDGLGGGAIDDPGMAQPSIGRIDEPEAGRDGGSLDKGGENPGGAPEDVPVRPEGDPEGLRSSTDNIRAGNVFGVMGGARQAQGQGQGG